MYIRFCVIRVGIRFQINLKKIRPTLAARNLLIVKNLTNICVLAVHKGAS